MAVSPNEALCQDVKNSGNTFFIDNGKAIRFQLTKTRVAKCVVE